MMDGAIHYSGNERDVKVGLIGWASEKYLNVEFYPYMATSVEVRYWDTAASKIIHSEMLHGDMVVNENETKIDVNIQPPEGYEMTGWNVQFTDGYIQYTGTENPTTVILNGFVPKKYLNVECTAKSNTKLTVKYVDLETERVLNTEVIYGEEAKGTAPVTIKAELAEIPGYMIEVWHIHKPDGTIETSGVEDYAEVVLTENIPHKILVVECFRIWDDGGDDEDDVELSDPTITVKPSGSM